MIDIKSLNLQEMTQLLRDMGEPAFRGKQVYTWLHKGVTSFEEMSNLSKPLRAKLQEQCYITVPTVARKQCSAQDGTVKYLWRLGDGKCIEILEIQAEGKKKMDTSSFLRGQRIERGIIAGV